jgi:nitrate reductase gamma subunit
VPTVVLLIFVFASHLRCDDARTTWEIKPHVSKWGTVPHPAEPSRPPLRPEAEPQQAPARR